MRGRVYALASTRAYIVTLFKICPAPLWHESQRRGRFDGAPVDLSGREWAVLARLANRPDAIVSKGEIEEALYAFGSEIESNTVEVYVSRLRKKLGKDCVETLRGIGYRLGR